MKRQSAWLAWALVVSTLAYMVGVAVSGQSAVTPAPGFSGYATATGIHVDAVQSGTTRLVDTELAFSAAATNSSGFGSASLQNEMQVTLQPNTPTPAPGVVFTGKNSSARGSGLELGVNNGVPSAVRTTLAQNVAEAVAPPNSALVSKQTLVPVNPLVYASLLRGQAQANFDDNPCLFGVNTPLAYGLGYIADAQLVNATGGTQGPDGFMSAPVVASDDPNPFRAVSQSRSFTYAAPNGDGTYGLVSETRSTFAPVNIARGGPAPAPKIIVELLGEWIFRATATGKTGGAKITYTTQINGVEPTDPSTPVIRISLDGGTTYQSITFAQVFGANGQTVSNAAVNIALGEKPRAIVAPGTLPPSPAVPPNTAADGTVAAGAVDAVRLQLIPGAAPGAHVADLRIGHFEASATVPPGGFQCQIVPPTTTPTTVPGTTTTTGATTTTTAAPTTTTTTTAPTTTTRPPTTLAPSTTAAPPSTAAPTTQPAPAPPPQAPPARPVVVSPSFVG